MSERYDAVVVGLGALGSAAAWQLARRGLSVLGLEQFELGHARGASHDTSRILRHSYHTAEYVRLTQEAYADWADLSAAAGRDLVTVVGGLDLFPTDPAIPMIDYTDALTEVGVPFELLSVEEIEARWPQFRLPEGTVGLFQERGAIVPAGPGTAAMQELAGRHGAVLRDRASVTAVTGTSVTLADGSTVECGAVVLCADAWTNRLLAPLGHELPLTVTLEQATYFAPERPEEFAPDRMPLWIWMDEPSFYGFPCYGEPTIKAAQDCGGPAVDPDARGTEPDEAMLDLLAGHVARTLPGSGRPVRSLRCQYTLTPDRDFVIDRVPGHPSLVVGLGAGHGFKFAPTFGRLLAELVVDPGKAASPTFALDRPALTDPTYAAHWLV
ncbi:N-methyl-L-tryptophan oxidase [Nocardioides sp. GY 10113]|uniref:N-methyl-L-tryptophan oxidase n=1 Tax=Nocardioides sp. GY 10113 TaxID=2569761 RepID=UPI00145803EE|nr:N-methyl-L-tryptophan oxidase [Nocardioides sp. GY 10113]